jgi:putative flippase GtrA
LRFEQLEDSPLQPGDRQGESLDSPGRKHGLLRITKFAAAVGIGFLVAEAILALGVTASYHTTEVPGLAHSSFTVLGLDVLAFGTGVTVAFIINERVTIEHLRQARAKGRASWLVRWCRYQLASLLGNVVIVGVQLALLATVSLSPILGTVMGAVISYPLTYLVSMRFVWGVNPLRADRMAKMPASLFGQKKGTESRPTLGAAA